MAAGDPVAELETKDRGCEISKEVVTDGKHAQVELELFSTHGDSLVARLEEPLPEGTTPTQIGFLPNHEPADAQVTDHGTFRLDADLDPWVVDSIIYGIKNVGDVDALAEEPQVIDIDGGGTGNDDADETQTATADDGTLSEQDTEESKDDAATGWDNAPAAESGSTGWDSSGEDSTEWDSSGEDSTGWTDSPATDESSAGGRSPAESRDDTGRDTGWETTESGGNRDSQSRNGSVGESPWSSKDGGETDGPSKDGDEGPWSSKDSDEGGGLTIDRYENLTQSMRTDHGEGSSLDLPLDERTARLLAAQLQQHMDAPTGDVGDFDARVAALEDTAASLERQLATVRDQLDELRAWREAIADASDQTR